MRYGPPTMDESDLPVLFFDGGLPDLYRDLVEGRAIAVGPDDADIALADAAIAGGKRPWNASVFTSCPRLRVVSRTGVGIRELIGKTAVLRALKPEEFADAQFGVPTVKDILAELDKPGRDPRPEFRTAAFTEGVQSIGDLTPGMMLEGVVTNVANFGAFVDIGVHQDGLVHVSQLADRFVKDPRDVVKAGDIV